MCQDEWDALKSIQSHMRKNSTEWARQEEHRRHKTYQDCRKGKNKQSEKSKNHSNNNQTYTHYRVPIKHKKYRSTISKVNVNGRFKGDKQQAWLDYYHAPQGCKNPKSTSQFSKCLQDRDNQAEIFEQVWLEQKAPPSIKLGTH
jgi:hypothetical protein